MHCNKLYNPSCVGDCTGRVYRLNSLHCIQNLRRIAYQTKNNPVDIIIYVDRLDMKTDDLDIQV